MAERDIYSPNTSDTTIHNGSIVVNPGGPFLTDDNGCIRIDTSYLDESIPAMSSLSGKYDLRYDDVGYYTKSG